jgi:hypothetical protein
MAWYFKRGGTLDPLSQGQDIIQKHRHQFGLKIDGDNFDLVLKSPVLSDGAAHVCEEDTYSLAQLVVFGKAYFYVFTEQSLPFLRGKYSDLIF